MNIPNGRYIMGVDLAKAGDQLVLVPMRRNVPVFQQAIAVSNDEFGRFMAKRANDIEAARDRAEPEKAKA